jgi:rhamnosyltransferase
MKKPPVLLHPEAILGLPFSGKSIARALETRAAEISRLTADLPDQPVSIVIRTRNNEAYIKSLLEDIERQVYDAPVEVILVDTESTDRTVAIARQFGARVINIKQTDFTYPRALNLGFEAAKHPYVMSLVGHSNLSNRYNLKCLTFWAADKRFGGLYCGPLANHNASRTERLGIGLGLSRRYRQPKIEKAESPAMGVLGANGAIVNKSVWQKLGKFDEHYAGGGEDSALGHVMLNHGYLIVSEPLCAVLHSHNLGPVDNIRQYLHWREVGKPSPFIQSKILKRRPDLRA